MKTKNERKPRNEYQVFGKKIFAYSAEQALGAYFKGRRYDFEEYLPTVDKHVKLIKESRLEKGISETVEVDEWGVSREGKEHAVSIALSESFYKNHPEKAENSSQFYPRYEQRTAKMPESQLDALYAKLCLHLKR